MAAQSWDLVREGIFVGYQLDRVFAPRLGLARSNGCSYADSPHHVPIQRMANVSLAPAADDISTDDLIARVDDGIYVVGDKSWSIDMQRYNFQFTGQRFFRIRNGRLDASSATSPPGHHHRFLERDGSGRRAVDLAPGARSTAARPSPARWRRSATAVRRRCSAASTCSTPLTKEGTKPALASIPFS